MALHEEPECDVTIGDDGLIHVRHQVTGETATAADERQLILKGILLRVRASWAGDPELWTGDPT